MAQKMPLFGLILVMIYPNCHRRRPRAWRERIFFLAETPERGTLAEPYQRSAPKLCERLWKTYGNPDRQNRPQAGSVCNSCCIEWLDQVGGSCCPRIEDFTRSFRCRTSHRSPRSPAASGSPRFDPLSHRVRSHLLISQFHRYIRKCIGGKTDILRAQKWPETKPRRSAVLCRANRLMRQRRTMNPRARQNSIIAFQHARELSRFQAVNPHRKHANAIFHAA